MVTMKKRNKDLKPKCFITSTILGKGTKFKEKGKEKIHLYNLGGRSTQLI
jgi:hypothetical protein